MSSSTESFESTAYPGGSEWTNARRGTGKKSRTNNRDRDSWYQDALPPDIQAMFDALPKSIQEPFAIKVDNDKINAREYCKDRIRALRANGWQQSQAIELAKVYPYGFGILGPHSWEVFPILWKELADAEAEREKQKADAANAKRQSGRLRIISVTELLALPPRDYLVKGWISPDETSLLVGAKNARKTFAALHVDYGIAQGWLTIFGRRVHQAPVLYLIAEGQHGIGKRVAALVKRYVRCDAFHVIAQPIDLLRSTVDAGDLKDIIALAKANGVRKITVDTISRALAGGDENGPTDMGILSGNLNVLRHETGAHVMGVHHGTQADGTKSRGHSVLPFGVDVIVQQEWTGAADGIGTLTLGFVRDDAAGTLGAFSTEVVNLGPDQDNEQIATLIINEMDAPPPETGRPLNQRERNAKQFLADLIVSEGKPLPIGSGFPLGLLGVREDRWRDECETRRLSTAAQRDSRTTAFRRTFEDLRDHGVVATRDGLVWLVK